MKKITYIKTENYIYNDKEYIYDYVAICGDDIRTPQLYKISHDKLEWDVAELSDGTHIFAPIYAKRIIFNRFGKIYKIVHAHEDD